MRSEDRENIDNRKTGCLARMRALSGNGDGECLGERRLGGSERVFMQIL